MTASIRPQSPSARADLKLVGGHVDIVDAARFRKLATARGMTVAALLREVIADYLTSAETLSSTA